MTTQIWLEDPKILLKRDKLMEIWPTAKMTPSERVNAITRLIIGLTFIGYLLTMSIKVVAVGLVAIICIVVLFYAQRRMGVENKEEKKKIKESFSNKMSEVFPAFTDPKTYELVKDNLERPTKKKTIF